MERELITKAARFRYTILDAAPDAAGVLTPPLALTKLALFVITAHREQGKWIGSSAHPYVLCVRDEARGVYVVVGVTYAQRRGKLQRKCVFPPHLHCTASSTTADRGHNAAPSVYCSRRRQRRSTRRTSTTASMLRSSRWHRGM